VGSLFQNRAMHRVLAHSRNAITCAPVNGRQPFVAGLNKRLFRSRDQDAGGGSRQPGSDGQRTVSTTVPAALACQEWSSPGPQTM